MALSASKLEQLVLSKLQAAGFTTSGEHAKVGVIAKAVAESVVEHITADAQVPVSSGSSAGVYKVS